MFIDELARNTSELWLFMHTAVGKEIAESDYRLESRNIVFISLGKKQSPWKRTFFSRSIIKKVHEKIDAIDAFLIRSPSPMVPKLNVLGDQVKIFYLVVGDYGEGAEQIGRKGIKNFLLYTYFKYVDRKIVGCYKTRDLFVNSPELFSKYEDKSKSIQLIRTTTLRGSDFSKKSKIELSNPIELLYTGRIDVTKGLRELIHSVARLNNALQYNVKLNIVGWEPSFNKPVEKELLGIAKEHKISDKIVFHGKAKIGDELNNKYRSADIYVLPSYHEGFPRTIWESMANSLPVIATNVGAIPLYLKNEHHALLIEPRDVDALTDAIKRMIDEESTRNRLLENGFLLAQEASLETQTSNLMNKIKDKL